MKSLFDYEITHRFVTKGGYLGILTALQKQTPDYDETIRVEIYKYKSKYKEVCYDNSYKYRPDGICYTGNEAYDIDLSKQDDAVNFTELHKNWYKSLSFKERLKLFLGLNQ